MLSCNFISNPTSASSLSYDHVGVLELEGFVDKDGLAEGEFDGNVVLDNDGVGWIEGFAEMLGLALVEGLLEGALDGYIEGGLLKLGDDVG
jgi:hypothetical protein